jgi:hypothetical protein
MMHMNLYFKKGEVVFDPREGAIGKILIASLDPKDPKGGYRYREHVYRGEEGAKKLRKIADVLWMNGDQTGNFCYILEHHADAMDALIEDSKGEYPIK